MLSHSFPHRLLLRFAATALAMGALLGSAGCFKATFINPAVVPGETHEEWTDFFLGGLVGTEEFDVREFCPGEAAKVATGGDFLTGLVSVVTVGIYVPRKVYVTCAAGRPVPATALPPATAPVPWIAPQSPSASAGVPAASAVPPAVAPTAPSAAVPSSAASQPPALPPAPPIPPGGAR